MALTEQSYKSIAECSVCSRLADTEYSFSKYGWPDHDVSMSPVCNQLVNVDKDKSGYNDRHHLLRCTECGTYYQYDYTYEYLVNGSEDEETITRLTPVGFRHRISHEEFDQRMHLLRLEITQSDANAKLYAVKSVTEYSVDKGDFLELNSLIVMGDEEIQRGILYFIFKMIEAGPDKPLIEYLRKQAHVLKQMEKSDNEKIRNLVWLITKEAEKIMNSGYS